MDRSAFWKLSYGLYVVGVDDGGRPTGCVANTAFQVTSEPARFAVSLHNDNHTTGVLKKSGALAVSILSEGATAKEIGVLGFRSGRDTDKFAGIGHALQGGLPVMARESCCAYLLCRVVDSFDIGTHTLFLYEPYAAELMGDDPPMTYDYYHRVIKGSAPKNAPTFRAGQ